MKTPSFFHLVKTLPVSLVFVLTACGGDNTPESTATNTESTQKTISISQQDYSEFVLPKRFVNGQPVHFVNETTTARRALPSNQQENLTGDFTQVTTSPWQTDLLNLPANVQGGFFVRLKLTTNETTPLPNRLFFSLAQSEQNVLLCSPCNTQAFTHDSNNTEIDITLTGINPDNFGLTQGNQTVEIWGQTTDDIESSTIRLVASQSFSWQPRSINLTSIERTAASVSVNWQLLAGDYTHYNVYWQQDNQAQQQKLSLTNNSFSFPSTGGNYQLQVKGIDAHGESAQSEIVLLGNQAPVFTATKITLSEDSQSQFNIASAISDNEDHQVTFATGTFSTNNQGSVTLTAEGDVTYTPAADFAGTDSFSFELADEFNATTTAFIEFEVLAVNDAPVAVEDSFNITSGQTSFQIPYTDLLNNDSDKDANDQLTLVQNSIQDIENAEIQATNDGLTFTVSSDFIGQVRFSYQASDGTALSNRVNVEVNVGDLTQSVRAINDSYQIDEDLTLTDNLTANDSINASLPLTLSVITQPNHGSLILDQSGQFTYQPSADFNGTDSFNYQIAQADISSQATVSITVNPINDLPRLQADNYSLDKGELLTILAPGVLANDSEVDGESLTVSLITPTTQGEVSLNADGSFSYQANDVFVGNISFIYAATDTAGTSAQQTVSINIQDVNLPPVVSNGNFVTAEEQSISVSLASLAQDPEGDSLTYTIETDAQNGQTSIEAGILKYQPATNFFGNDQIIFSVSDGVNDKVNGRIDLSVTAVNDAPVITQSSFNVDEDTNKDIILADFVQDAEQDTVSYSIQQAPQFGQASIVNGTLSYTPNLNFSGLDSITLTLTDSQGLSNQVTIQFAVAIENDAPVFNVETWTGEEDVTLSIDLSEFVTDPDGDDLTFTLLAAALNGQTSLNANTLIFVPNPEFSGQDKVQLQVSDGLLTDSAEFPITIAAINDAPVAQNAQVSLNSNTSALVDLSAYASDVENDSLTYSIQIPATQGSASIDGSSLVYTPNAGFEGADSLSFLVNDGELNSNTATVSFTVANNQQSFTPGLIGHLAIDDTIYDIQVNQDVAYLATQSGIAIYDISDRTNPALLETLTTSSPAQKLYFHSGILYAILQGGNLESWDVSSDSTATNLASLHLGGEITDIAVAGPYLLLPNKYDGVDIVYSDNGQTLVKALLFNHYEQVNAVATNGDFIAMATEQSLYVINTDDIESPDLNNAAKYNLAGVSQMYLSANNMLHVACNLCGYKVFKVEEHTSTDSSTSVPSISLEHDNNRFFPADIAISQGYALFNDSLFSNALPIVNISNEQQPVFSQLIDLSSVSLSRSKAISIDNQYVYAVANNHLYIGQYRALANTPDDASSRFSLNYFAFLNPQVTDGAFFEIQAGYQISDNLNELVQSVSFYIDDVLLGTDTTWPFSYRAQAKSDDFVVKARFMFADETAFDVTQTLSPIPDSDSDGLSDLIELSHYNSDKDLTDSDSDEIADLIEAIIFSKLDSADSDSDGVNDKVELDANQSPISSDRNVPTIVSQSPSSSATDVCEYEPVIIKFDETISVRNLDTSNFYLTQNDQQIAAVVTFFEENKSIKLEPQNNLLSNSDYQVSVPAVADLAGNLTAAYSYTFSTGACTESARPSVASILPSNNSTDISTNTRVIIKIDEAVKTSTIHAEHVSLIDLTSNQTIAGTVSLQGDNDTIIFVPSSPLKSGRQHYLSLSTGITDLFDNPLFSFTARFTTGYQADTTAPELTTFSIRENDTSVPTNAVVAAKFSEAIDPLNLSGVNFTDLSNNQSVNYTLSLVDDNTRLLIQPDEPLTADTIYNVTVENVTDSSANILAQSKSLNFTTSGNSLSGTLDVSNWSFKSSQTQMPTLPVLTVAYNQMVDPTSINESTIYLWDNAASYKVATRKTWSNDQTRVSLTPLQALKSNRRYTIYTSYDQRIKDITNTSSQTYRTRSFTTGYSSDSTAPMLVDSGITTNALVVNQPIIVAFNEAINPHCENAQLKLTDNQGASLDYDLTISSDLTHIEVKPSEALVGESQYTLSITDFCDMAGNILPSQQLVLTSASDALTDTQAPQLVNVSPAHATNNVDVGTQISVTFDEVISPISTMKLTHSGIEVSGSTSVSGNTITFVPNESLRGGTRYTITTAYTVTDIFGNNGFISTRYFDTVSETDSTKPQVVSTAPINGQTEVDPTQTIQINLDEALTSNTINSANIALFHNGDKLSASISRSADNKSILVNSTLPEHAVVSLVLTNGLTDLDGNTLDPYVMSFTTGANANEVTRPRVIDVTPATSAYSLTNLDTLYVYMSESIDVSSLTDNLYLTQDGVLLPIDIDTLANDRIVKISTTNNFANNSLISLHLTSNITDVNGNYLYAYSTNLTMGDGIDTAGLRPYPVDYSPNSFSQIDIINPIVRVKFSEALSQGSVNTSNFVLTDTTQNSIVPIELNLSNNQTLVTVSPQIQLTAGNSYTLRIESSIVDTDGDSPTTTRSMYFTVNQDAIADDRAPQMRTISPADSTTNVPLQTQLSVRFDEAVDILSFDYLDETYNSLTISSDNKIITLKLTQPLAGNQSTTLTLPNIADFAGNPVADVSTTFTTSSELDFTSPTIVTQTELVNPMSRNPKLFWQFSETIDFTSLEGSQIYIFDTVENKQIPINSGLTHQGTRLYMQPETQLAADRRYYYVVYGLQDLVGRNISYQSSNFYTGFESDTAAPELIAASMLDGATNIPINHKINLQFNEAVTLVANPIIQLEENGESVEFDVSFSRGLTLLTITPKQLLKPDTQYQLIVNGIHDLAENSLAQGVVRNFTTGSQADLLTTDIENWSLVQSNQTDVALNPEFILEFSDVIDRATINSDSLYLYDNRHNQYIALDYIFADDLNSVKVKPAAQLEANKSYTLYISASPYITDLAGNRASYRWYNFTSGEDVDNTAPVLSATSFANNSSDIPVNAQISIQFNERISRTCFGECIKLVDSQGNAVALSGTMNSDYTGASLVPEENLVPLETYQLIANDLPDYSGNLYSGTLVEFSTGSIAIEDSIAPSLVNMTPVHASTEVDLATNQIQLSFDEDIALTSQIEVSANSYSVSGQQSVDGNTLTFTFDEALTPDTRYTISIYSNIKDFAGNSRNLSTRYFNTDSSVQDSTTPTIVSMSPNSGSTDNQVNAEIWLEFSEPMNASTLSSNNIRLFVNGELKSTSISRSADGKRIKLSAGTLASASTISVVLNNNVTDLADNSISPFIGSFTTGINLTESTRPYVTRQYPSTNSTLTFIPENIQLYLSEDLDAATIPAELQIAVNGETSLANLTLTAANVLTIEPNNAWQLGDRIDYSVPSQIRDLAGNYINNYDSNLVINDPANDDIYVTGYFPTSYATDLPDNAKLTVQFSQTLNPADVSDDFFALYEHNTGTLIPTRLSLHQDGNLVFVTPDQTLAADTFYRLTINNGIRASNGKTLASNANSYFTTAQQAANDDIAPSILHFSPADGLSNVGINPQFALKLDESINPLLFATSQWQDHAVMFEDNNTIVTYQKHQPLALNSDITETLNNLQDNAGNSSTDHTYNLTTAAIDDFVRPTLIDVNLINGQQSVATNANFELVYSEAINPVNLQTNAHYLYNSAAGEYVDISLSYSQQNSKLSITPVQAMDAGTGYSLYVGGIKDTSGNTGNALSYSFTTGFIPDVSAPIVVRSSIANGQTEIAINSIFRIEFNEAISHIDASQVELMHSSGNKVPVALSYLNDRTLVVVKPQTVLQANASYQLTLSKVTDLSNNETSNPVDISFVTHSTMDIANPSIVSFNFTNAEEVTSDFVPQITVSEVLDPTSINEQSFYIADNSGNKVAGEIIISADKMSLSYQPTNPLTADTIYYLYISASPYICDATGNRLSYTFRRFDTQLIATDGM
ncbi:Ig-like domain-containing protein [Catenovulum sp. SX2]|uniref:Ig-like domain-containing protein n=1 Tax=Catenovulum sp. SX2 TaxID=3398614 RepID=UPI003F82A698